MTYIILIGIVLMFLNVRYYSKNVEQYVINIKENAY